MSPAFESKNTLLFLQVTLTSDPSHRGAYEVGIEQRGGGGGVLPLSYITRASHYYDHNYLFGDLAASLR